MNGFSTNETGLFSSAVYLMAFSHLKYGEMGYDAEMELCLDILSCCDKLIVASIPSEGVRREIEFAKMVNMEVEYL